MRVYEKTYNSLEAPGGQRTCWILPFFCEGMIQKIIVKQVGGESVAFTMDVFNSRRACEGTSSSSGSSASGDPFVDPECYRVFETQTGVAGESVYLIESTGRAYRNMDGTWTNGVREIYLEIEPAGTADATWDVCVGGWTDVG